MFSYMVSNLNSKPIDARHHFSRALVRQGGIRLGAARIIMFRQSTNMHTDTWTYLILAFDPLTFLDGVWNGMLCFPSVDTAAARRRRL